jgi:hypothetical protein
MGKVLLDFRTTRNTIVSLLIVSSEFLIGAFPSMAGEIREPETHFRDCNQLQERLNERYNPEEEYKSFEESQLRREYYPHDAYSVSCNGGIMLDKVKNRVCRGFIAYSWAPLVGTARYYADWGNSRSPYDNGGDISDYCRPIKKLKKFR